MHHAALRPHARRFDGRHGTKTNNRTEPCSSFARDCANSAVFSLRSRAKTLNSITSTTMWNPIMANSSLGRNGPGPKLANLGDRQRLVESGSGRRWAKAPSHRHYRLTTDDFDEPWPASGTSLKITDPVTRRYQRRPVVSSLRSPCASGTFPGSRGRHRRRIRRRRDVASAHHPGPAGRSVLNAGIRPSQPV